MEPLNWLGEGHPGGSRMRGFGSVCKPRAAGGGHEFGGPVGLPVQYQAVSVVPKSVERGAGEQAIDGEGLIPLREVEVAGDDGRCLLVALGNEVVQILVGGRAKGFQAEVIDDEQRHAREGGKPPLVGADGTRSVEGRHEAGTR